MHTKEISNGLPNEVTRQLMPGEKVYYFSYTSINGGCNSKTEINKHWLALTDRRVMYKTKVTEMNGQYARLVEKDGDLPFDQISFIEVSEASDALGCGSNKSFQLKVSTSGGTIAIPIPTKEKGYDIRKVYSEVSRTEK